MSEATSSAPQGTASRRLVLARARTLSASGAWVGWIAETAGAWARLQSCRLRFRVAFGVLERGLCGRRWSTKQGRMGALAMLDEVRRILVLMLLWSCCEGNRVGCERWSREKSFLGPQLQREPKVAATAEKRWIRLDKENALWISASGLLG